MSEDIRTNQQKLRELISKNIFEIITAILAIIAIITSAVSCSVSNKSLDIAQEQLEIPRRVIWLGTLDNQNRTIQLRPMNNEINMQIAHIYFPSVLDDFSHTLTGPDFSSKLQPLTLNIKSWAQINYSSTNPEVTTEMESIVIPIIIKSNYVAQGNTYDDISAYLLQLSITIHPETDIDKNSIEYIMRFVSDPGPVNVDINYKELIFVKRLGDKYDENDIDYYLTGSWEIVQNQINTN
jgi:hypothetical protein